MLKKIFVALAALVLLCSCGYKFEGGQGLPGGLEKVSVGFFENRTGFAGVNNILNEEFAAELSQFGFFSDSEADSQGVLSGEILNIRVSDISGSSSYEKRIAIKLNIELKDKSGNVLYQRKNISENYVFESSSGQTSGFGVPDEALREVAEKAAEKVVSVMSSGF
jgi:outer membrane lipopolysaccharide assembly protein LptE/RlpB